MITKLWKKDSISSSRDEMDIKINSNNKKISTLGDENKAKKWKFMVYIDATKSLKNGKNNVNILIIHYITSKWYIKIYYFVENFILILMIYNFIGVSY